jgi:hypothetical protein
MDQTGIYLRSLAEDYLSTAADRREVVKVVLGYMATVALILASAVILWAW